MRYLIAREAEPTSWSNSNETSWPSLLNRCSASLCYAAQSLALHSEILSNDAMVGEW